MAGIADQKDKPLAAVRRSAPLTPGSSRNPPSIDGGDASIKPGPRGMIGWLMRLSAGPRALSAFGAISALESALLPIPIDAVMIPLLLAQPKRFWIIVLIGTIGSVLGGLFGYFLGAVFYETIARSIISFYGLAEEFEIFRDLYIENGVLAVVIAGITPVPFKLGAIMAGVAGMRLELFLMAAFGIRLFRFVLIAGCIRLIGPSVQLLMERHGWKFLVCLLAIMLGGLFLLPVLLA